MVGGTIDCAAIHAMDAINDSPRTGADRQSPNPGTRRNLWVFPIKLALPVAILVFLVMRIDLSECASAIKQVISVWLGVAFLCSSLPLGTSTLKWDRPLRGLGVRLSRWTLLQPCTIRILQAHSFLGPSTVTLCNDTSRERVAVQY